MYRWIRLDLRWPRLSRLSRGRFSLLLLVCCVLFGASLGRLQSARIRMLNAPHEPCIAYYAPDQNILKGGEKTPKTKRRRGEEKDHNNEYT